MDQSFLLKYHLNIDLSEQSQMTAEERKFFLDRLNKQREEENDAMRGSTSTPGKIPESPGAPPIR